MSSTAGDRKAHDGSIGRIQSGQVLSDIEASQIGSREIAAQGFYDRFKTETSPVLLSLRKALFPRVSDFLRTLFRLLLGLIR